MRAPSPREPNVSHHTAIPRNAPENAIARLAIRTYKSGAAASGCPDWWSGYRVSANKRLPAAILRKSAPERFSFTWAELTAADQGNAEASEYQPNAAAKALR